MSAAELSGAGRDPWTLLAIAYAGDDGRGVNLATIRNVTGIIRQAALTDESLREELGRLERAGLVEVREGKYHPTGPFLEFLRTRANRRGVQHDYEDLIQFLGRHAPTEGGPEADGS